MTPEILAWGERVVRDYELEDDKTIELGAYNVNGSLSQFFDGYYLGVDQFPGPGVDVVGDIRDVTGTYDVVVCTEVIEHDPRPWEVIAKCACLLREGGHLILTAPSIQFHRHDYPGDYYRYTESGLRALVEWAGLEVLESAELPGHVYLGQHLTWVHAATSVLVARR